MAKPIAPAADDAQAHSGTVRLKVAHFILDHRVGGPHVYVATLRKAMAGQVESLFVTSGRGPMTELALLNLRRFWKPLYALESLLNALLIVLRLGLGPKSARPQLFHVHGAGNIAPLLAARLCRVPVVWHFHETVALHGAIARWGMRLIQPVPHELLTVAPVKGAGFPGDGGTLVPGLVDTAFWQPDVAAAPTAPVGWTARPQECDDPPLRLLAVANLNPLKGIDVLLEALSDVPGPIELRLVGSDLDTQREYSGKLRAQAAELKRRNPRAEVVFLGWQPPEAVRGLLKGVDLFVLPSRSEACPIALLEAMAMEVACVATDVGAVRDMLPKAQHDLIVPANDSVALAKALASAMAMPAAARRALATGNRAQVQRLHSPQRIATMVANAYASVAPPHCRVRQS